MSSNLFGKVKLHERDKIHAFYKNGLNTGYTVCGVSYSITIPGGSVCDEVVDDLEPVTCKRCNNYLMKLGI